VFISPSPSPKTFFHLLSLSVCLSVHWFLFYVPSPSPSLSLLPRVLRRRHERRELSSGVDLDECDGLQLDVQIVGWKRQNVFFVISLKKNKHRLYYITERLTVRNGERNRQTDRETGRQIDRRSEKTKCIPHLLPEII
jgi:hypothetical protein